MSEFSEMNTSLEEINSSINNLEKNIIKTMSTVSSSTQTATSAFQTFSNNLDKASKFSANLTSAYDKFDKVSSTINNVSKATEGFNTAQKMSASVTKSVTILTSADTLAKEVQTVATVTETVATEGATVAQSGLNAAMKANPISALISLLALVVGGIMAYAASCDDSVTASDTLSKSVSDQADAYEKQKEQTAEQLSLSLSQIDYVKELYAELEKLTDSQGKVNEGDKAYAELIIKQVNEYLPNAIELQDDLSITYNNTQESIEALLEQKRAQIILDAKEADYILAIQNKATAEQELAEAEAVLNQQRSEMAELQQAQDEALANGQYELANSYAIEMAAKQEQVDGAQSIYDTAAKTYDGYLNTMQGYETDYIAIASGDQAAIAEINQRGVDDYGNTLSSKESAYLAHLDQQGLLYQQENANLIAFNGNNQAALEQQVVDTATYAEIVQRKYKDGVAGVTAEMVTNAQTNAEKAKAAYLNTGENLAEGLGDGASSKSDWFATKLSSLVEKGVNAAKKAGDMHSPSRKMRDEVGKNLALGIGVGFEDELDPVIKRMQDKMVRGQNKLISSVSPYSATVVSSVNSIKDRDLLITGNSFTIREEADIEKVAYQLNELYLRGTR